MNKEFGNFKHSEVNATILLLEDLKSALWRLGDETSNKVAMYDRCEKGDYIATLPVNFNQLDELIKFLEDFDDKRLYTSMMF